MDKLAGIKKNRTGVIETVLMLFATLGAVMVSAKMLFAGFAADEEFQMVLAYRLATGDRLLGEVWDLIQPSAFLSEWLIRLFLFFTGGTEGILVYLRLCGLGIQFIVAVTLFLTIREQLGRVKAYLFAVLFYCSFIKLIALPDFSNMHMWFYTLMILAFWWAYRFYKAEKWWALYCLLTVSALFYCGAILSTACVITIPVVFIFLVKTFKQKKLGASLCFWGVCGLTALIYILSICISLGSFQAMLFSIGNMISGDSTHLTDSDLAGNSKAVTTLVNLCLLAVSMALMYAAAIGVRFVLKRSKKGIEIPVDFLWIVIAVLTSLFNWFVLNTGYDGLKAYIPVIMICGLVSFLQKNREDREAADSILIPVWGIAIFASAIIGIQFVSNVPFNNNLAFMLGGMLWGVYILVVNYKALFSNAILIIICVTTIAGTGFCLMSSPVGNNIFELDGIIRNGPAKNVLVSKGVAWVYHTDYLEFAGIVPEGKNVLIVTDFFKNASVTSCYMLNNVKISHYSVNSTPTYSEQLLKYWEMYPDRVPDVIMVNKYSVSLNPGTWIGDYVISQFDYSDVYETENATYYIR